MGPNLLGTVGSQGCRGTHPVIREQEANSCKSARGGTKTIGAPGYQMTVTDYTDPNQGALGAPVNLGIPTITGRAQVGYTLSGDNGIWTNAPTGYAYQWMENGIPIGGATENTLFLTETQVGEVITFQVIAFNIDRSSAPETSDPTRAVLPLVPVNITIPVITGAVQDGGLLFGSSGTWTNTSPKYPYPWVANGTVVSGTLAVYTYQWMANGTPIVGATANTFLLTTAQDGASITLQVTATNVAGSSAPATSEPTGVVVSVTPLSVTLPVITGTAQDGDVLSGSNGTWTNTPTSYVYQWLANGTPIGGATANTFLLTAAQVGEFITFQVIASNAGRNSAPATSAPTSAVLPVASFQVTTTAPTQTLTIGWLTTSAPMVADWGDSIQNSYNGANTPTHTYAVAGTYLIRFLSPLLVTTLVLNDPKVTLTSAKIKTILNVTDFEIESIKAGVFNSADVSVWRPTNFQLYTMPAGYAGTFNSADVSAWRPTTFEIYGMPAGYTGAFNSSDVSAWRPTTFFLYGMTAGYTGAFNSSDVSAWRPSNFYLNSLPAGYTGTFNSSEVSAWRPTTFNLATMPAGYAGTFNSANVSAWSPNAFYLATMPAGYSGTFNSSDVSAWRPTTFNVSNLPAGYAGTFNSADVSAWRPTSFELYTMPAGYAGSFNSSDASAWRPTTFSLYSLPAGYSGTFNSSDVNAWRPTYFSFSSMSFGYTGTFNSSDVSAWRPTTFFLYALPTGYAGTFTSSDVSAWRPFGFYLYNSPAGYGVTVSAGGFSAWTSIMTFQMNGNALTQGQVDQILTDFYTAFPTKATTGGAIILNGSNAAPSGIFQSHCPPTSGKETAYDLLNNPCSVNSEVWYAVATN